MTRRRVVIVGSGTRFLSGISYYTILLTRRLAHDHDVSVVLMRALVPRFLYPGRDRVGSNITELRTNDVAPTFDGINWTMVPSLPRAQRFIHAQHPEVIVLQWWSASTLPAYLAIARLARRGKIPLILELHEGIETAEAKIPVVRTFADRGLRYLVSRANAFIVHSEFDRDHFVQHFGLRASAVRVVPLGPFPLAGPPSVGGSSRDEVVTILFFGTIRPYKGLEDLVDAFELLPRGDDQRKWRLLIVGETWEGWTLPFEKVAASAYGSDIEVVNRYVTDAQVPEIFDRATIVALPYLRSSASGPLHLTMAKGLPVVVSDVGGLRTAAQGYRGAVFVTPSDPVDLARGLVETSALASETFTDPRSWDQTAAAYEDVFTELLSPSSTRDEHDRP